MHAGQSRVRIYIGSICAGRNPGRTKEKPKVGKRKVGLQLIVKSRQLLLHAVQKKVFSSPTHELLCVGPCSCTAAARKELRHFFPCQIYRCIPAPAAPMEQLATRAANGCK